MQQEVNIVSKIVDRLNNQTIPDKMAEIEKRIADATTNSNTELTNCIDFV